MAELGSEFLSQCGIVLQNHVHSLSQKMRAPLLAFLQVATGSGALSPRADPKTVFPRSFPARLSELSPTEHLHAHMVGVKRQNSAKKQVLLNGLSHLRLGIIGMTLEFLKPSIDALLLAIRRKKI